jgi:hypothetical protein
MIRKSVGALCILASCLLTTSCEKLPPTGGLRPATGPLKFEPAKFNDAIPDAYGTLVGVTHNNPDWVGLWFQKPDRTITVVFVNIIDGKIYEKSLTIPRK